MSESSNDKPHPLRALWRRWMERLERTLGTPPGDDRRDRSRRLELRFQSVMITLATAGIIWAVQTISRVDKTADVLAVQIGYLQANAARADSAQRDIAEVRRDLTEVHGDIETIKVRLTQVERATPVPAERVRR